MVANFLAGGAAINVLCKEKGIATRVVDCGIRGGGIEGTMDARVGDGTADFSEGPAMTEEQMRAALDHGARLAEGAAGEFDGVGIGEMGIGNTTAAAALLCGITGLEASECVGRGAGLDDEGLERKERVIGRAVARLRSREPLEVLCEVGGFEIAVMAGFLIGAAAARLPVVVDGFIASAPALVAGGVVPGTAERLVFSHLSAERGHRVMLGYLGVQPMLQLDLRLGEGTGAALAMGLVGSAVGLYREMATFESAAVSQQIQ
jgi:nicotinate-nucleotide--dimethylbenzimidazole phosphoribosyltransferase